MEVSRVSETFSPPLLQLCVQGGFIWTANSNQEHLTLSRDVRRRVFRNEVVLCIQTKLFIGNHPNSFFKDKTYKKCWSVT